jgi:opacity protein-like surface antigen
MKKIILAATAVAVLSSTTALASADMFYVKANVGWDKMTKIKGFKTNNDVFLGLGVGYYVMDNVRTDLTYDHYFNPTFKKTIAGTNVKVKARADSLLINGFVDLFDVSVAKIFAGVGVGMSMISAKLSTSAGGGGKFKKKNNFAYALYLGASTEFAPGVNGELTYSYRDMGKFKTPANSDKFGNLRGHHLAVGVRFDM